jgi:hypothetical protein
MLGSLLGIAWHRLASLGIAWRCFAFGIAWQNGFVASPLAAMEQQRPTTSPTHCYTIFSRFHATRTSFAVCLFVSLFGSISTDLPCLFQCCRF